MYIYLLCFDTLSRGSTGRGRPVAVILMTIPSIFSFILVPGIYTWYKDVYIYSYLVEGFPLGIVADFKARGVSRAEKGVHS